MVQYITSYSETIKDNLCEWSRQRMFSCPRGVSIC